MWSRTRLVLCILLAVSVVLGLTGGLVLGQTFPRNETLYTGGKQWGPVSNWNPFMTGNQAMGTIGLCYETLFLYDPLTDQFIPWLAESGKWLSSTVYELKIRQGVKWSDGQPLTAADVKFTFELGKTAALNITSLWDWLDNIVQVGDYYLEFHFKAALYQEWANNLYNIAIVPQHIWGKPRRDDRLHGCE